MITIKNCTAFVFPFDWIQRHWKCVSRAFGGTREGASAGTTPAPLKRRLQHGLRRHSNVVCSAVQAPMEAPLTAPLEVLERATQDAVKARFRAPFQRL